MPNPAPRSAALSSMPPSANSRKTFSKSLPADPVGELLALGRKHFSEIEDYPEARAFWWPRFERIARWFVNWEIERRGGIATIDAEIRGEHEIKLEKGSFRLRGIADRIELGNDGRYTIFDYKTGSARTEPQVRTGLAPQLTLEAAILRQGGFPEHPAAAFGRRRCLCAGERRRAARRFKIHRLQGRHGRLSGRTRVGKAHASWRRVSRTKTRPIARSCIRCGRPNTATMIISPACWNGPAPARKTTTGAANENGRRYPA